MARIKVETNSRIADAGLRAIAATLRTEVARLTGESVDSVGVEVFCDRRMRMAHDADISIAHVELKGVDFPKDRAHELTNAVCPVLEGEAGIPGDQVYIAVISPRNSMWRVNGPQTSAPAGDQ